MKTNYLALSLIGLFFSWARPLAAEDPPEVVAPASVSRALRGVAEAAAPAMVKLHVNRYGRSKRRSKWERASRRRLKLRLMREFKDRFRDKKDMDWSTFFRYLQRPAGPVSGVIVDRSGLVVTSRYNVEGLVRSVQVELMDGRFYPGRILGWDANLDVAVVRIQAAGETFPALAMEPVECPAVGSFVVVVGASWGRVPYTSNPGMVSAHNRLGGSALQLAAHLNYGNTGGAVLDLEGRFIGVAGHVRPFSRTGLNSGVGFATGITRLLKVLPDLEKGRRNEHASAPFMGIRSREVKKEKRIYVAQVAPGSGADEAGIEAGDILVSVAGLLIEDSNDLRLALARCRVGQKVSVVVNRGGVVLRLSVRLEARQ